MVDLILFTFSVSLFFFGFWCGKTFLSFSAMKAAIIKKISE